MEARRWIGWLNVRGLLAAGIMAVQSGSTAAVGACPPEHLTNQNGMLIHAHPVTIAQGYGFLNPMFDSPATITSDGSQKSPRTKQLSTRRVLRGTTGAAPTPKVHLGGSRPK
jgi:hypothetical protein